MNHGLNNNILYTACKLDVTFTDNNGDKKKGAGTGFFVENTRKELCLVTNRHLVDWNYKKNEEKKTEHKLTSIIIENKIIEDNVIITQVALLLNVSKFEYSKKYENDVACIKNAVVYSDSTNKPTVQFQIPYQMIADRNSIEKKLLVCDFVAFPGFPAWYDKKNNLPILRTGTIASDPRFDYSYSGKDDGDAIAYEAFSSDGSSGSPVFAVQRGIKVGDGLMNSDYREVMFIGINAGHLQHIEDIVKSHSGISYFYKSSVILEIIDK